ncbi:MAG: hypothetical protein GWN58_39150, partial [Anaerolineae bacterium]|nr:hypothetical protein [Anaerolineae bacterium]
MNRLSRDEVVIIEDEGVGATRVLVVGTGLGTGDSRDLVDQASQKHLDRRRLGSLERVQHALSHDGSLVRAPGQRLEGGGEVRQETGRVVVAFVKGDPGDRQGRATPAPVVGPFAQQRGLAKAGRRGDER